jgi:hypothetical protein
MRTRFLVVCLLTLLLVTAAACAKSDDGREVASVNSSAAPSPTPSLSLYEQRKRYAQCMRAHGVPEPDPTILPDGSSRRGRYDKDAVDRDVATRAEQACRPYEAVIPAGEMAPKLEAMREYSRCMRAHGVEDYPDPDPDGHVQLPREQTDPDYDQAKTTCDAQQAAAADSASPSR